MVRARGFLMAGRRWRQGRREEEGLERAGRRRGRMAVFRAGNASGGIGDGRLDGQCPIVRERLRRKGFLGFCVLAVFECPPERMQ